MKILPSNHRRLEGRLKRQPFNGPAPLHRARASCEMRVAGGIPTQQATDNGGGDQFKPCVTEHARASNESLANHELK